MSRSCHLHQQHVAAPSQEKPMMARMALLVVVMHESAVAASESSRHMYDQVIKRAWIMVYDLWLYMQSKGGKLVCVKTDSVTASFDSPSDLDIRCTLREEEPPALPPMISFNETVLEPTIPTPPDPIEVGSSHRFTPPTSGMCILGRAGTGKSHVIRILEGLIFGSAHSKL